MIYLSSFKLSERKVNNPNIYPYNVFRDKYIEPFVFIPITVFYGNNGSGKSTLLNIIANCLQLFAQEKYSNGETSMQYFEEYLQPDALYLLDEPEVSLSPANQVMLAEEINKMARLLGCQFIIATHSPFMLGTLNAKIYNLDTEEYDIAKWSDLDNVRYFYNFFKKHEDEFKENHL